MKQKIWKRIFTVIIAVLSITFVAGCSQPVNSNNITSQQTQVEKSTENNNGNSNGSSVNGKLKVHYINVGQGDSILVQQGDKNMLIDAGTNASTSSLISYLRSQNIKKIDYLVLTHPHEDHIGGADAVIKTFEIGSIYMPKVTANTATFRDVVKAMNAKGLKALQPIIGTNYNLGQAACEILGPVTTVNGDLNTYSIVIKVTFGNNKFLFTGDAQASNEQDMINKGFDLSADVLKLGHHGSHTSTSQNFLNKVNPKYAIISCGVDNDYGHPHKETMDRLKRKNVIVYRTDESGTIVAESDGKDISFRVKPGDYRYGSQVKK
ncbi:MAG: ComE-like protein Metallo beta-lactamase superfamily hydrolase, secreted [Clostridiaceae bacterium]|jgi:competence protein ComEC|nr:ComE-like protein Metallo beta-lactamase superfamily hydrolase, secreted [Clostridiaceae bacterium]